VKTIYIEVDNLKCGGCENTIKKQLKKITQVVDVKAHFESSAVEVTFNQTTDESELYSTLKRLGYPAKGTSNRLQNLKSYVSCAIGRLSSEK